MVAKKVNAKKKAIEEQKERTAALVGTWADGYAQGCCETAAWAATHAPEETAAEFRRRYGARFELELEKRQPQEEDEGSIFD